MDEFYITIGQLRAFAEVQKAGIDASCNYGSTSKLEARQLKDTIDFLIKTVSQYAISCNQELNK